MRYLPGAILFIYLSTLSIDLIDDGTNKNHTKLEILRNVSFKFAKFESDV